MRCAAYVLERQDVLKRMDERHAVSPSVVQECKAAVHGGQVWAVMGSKLALPLQCDQGIVKAPVRTRQLVECATASTVRYL